MSAESSIREVIAFPKTAAVDLMSDASPVDAKQLRELHSDRAQMKKIAVRQEGIETLYGPHDANLKHIESLMDVEIRTQGDELIVEGTKNSEQRVERLFDQLAQLRDSGYELASADVKTAAELVVDDPNVDLRDYFSKNRRRRQPQGQNGGSIQEPEPEEVSRYDRAERHRVRRRSGRHGQDLPGDGAGRQLLDGEEVSRIILARPAVEAGKSSGSCRAICRRR